MKSYLFAWGLLAALALPARADIVDSGNLQIGGQGVIGGTFTVQGSALGVAGAVSATSATLSGSGANIFTLTTSSGVHILAGGIKWPDGTTSTTAVSGGGSALNSTFTFLTSEYSNAGANLGPCILGSTITLTTAGGPVEVSFTFSQAHDVSGGGTRIQVLMDGGWMDDFGPGESMAPMSRESGGSSVQIFPTQLSYRSITPPSAGSHSFCITLERNAVGTSYIFCKKSTTFGEGPKKCLFMVQELE